MLEGQCTSWGGPVVAILYLSLELFDTNNALHIEQARAQAADLHARMEEAGEGARVDFWAGGWVAPEAGNRRACGDSKDIGNVRTPCEENPNPRDLALSCPCLSCW